jgi:NADPH2:quinone reductase
MRAMVVRQYGGPEALELDERAAPEPGEGEVRVDLRAAGVNFVDTYQRSGTYRVPLPFVAGSEGAGVVSAVGPGVTGTVVGDRVTWAMVRGAGYAEQVLVPEEQLVPIPAGVSEETAAAVMLQGLTAHFLCTSTYAVQSGDTVLIHAGAGGVGLLLTQMVVKRGGRVITTTSTDGKAELSRGAGASDVVRYDREDVVERVRALTDGVGVAVVYDGVGKDTFDASLRCLRRRGMLVLFGASSGPVPPLDPQVLNRRGSLFLTRPTLYDHTLGREELLWRAADVLGWVADGSLDVRVGARYPLEQAARAHQDLESRRTTGKSLLVL